MHVRYRAEIERTATQLEAAAKIAAARGLVMRAGVPRHVKQRVRAQQYKTRLQLAGVPALVPAGDDELGAQAGSVHQVNDGIYVSTRLENPVWQQEVARWLNKMAWNMRVCGRSAVGVGLLRRQADLPGEKVYCATCKGRSCPACNARKMAHHAPALKRMVTEEFNQGERLFFATLTVRHRYADTLTTTREVLDRAWKLFIRLKFVVDTFDERLRVAEVEFTKKSGFHPHFHLLLRMQRGCKASYWSRDKVYAKLVELWTRCTERAGRRSWKVDLRELVAVHDEDSNIRCVRYWLRPEERAHFEKLERDGLVKLHRKGEHLSREQTLDDVVDELCKYVTSQKQSGKKTNQVSADQWKPWMRLEYEIGIRYWNLRRASKGWEQKLLEYGEEFELEREIEADKAGGYEYFPWAAIVALCKRAAEHHLTPAQANKFAADFPRILTALQTEGCDISADMIKGYIFRFFGDTEAPLAKLSLTPWEKRDWQEEEQAIKVAEARAQQQLKARHWRILLRLRRRHDQGAATAALSGLGMSRRRLTECVEDLQREGLIATTVEEPKRPGGRGKARYALTDVGRRMIPTCLPDPRKKHEARKALRDLQQVLPGMTWLEEDSG